MNFYVNKNREIMLRVDYYKLASGYYNTHIYSWIYKQERQKKLNYILKNKKLKLKKGENKNMKKLYKFYWDCGRQGDVEGLFFANEENVKSAIGREVYFGEILGKHSEVYGTLDKGDLEVIDLPNDVVELLIGKLGSNLSGYNPLDYIEEEYEDEDNNFNEENEESEESEE